MAKRIVIDQPPAPPLTRLQAYAAQVRTRITVAERLALAAILFAALAQGLLYMLLVPPWQHYDEPTHFEHAWLAANRNWNPSRGDEDNVIRREIAASMLAHDFFVALPRPDLLTDDQLIWLGISELGHPPAYYLLVSLPLRLVRHLDVTTQLYVARSISLLLFVLTVAVAYGLMRDLTPPRHLLRWLVPLAVVFVPPFADLMSAVNNDVGAVFVFSVFLWCAVRLLQFGLTWPRAVGLCVAAALGVVVKNTAAPALLLAPLVILMAFWLRRGWRWRWLAASALAGLVLVLMLTLEWGDAAYWYRMSLTEGQASPTQMASAAAPVGAHVLVLEATPDSYVRQLIAPLLTDDVQRITGRTITIGGWVWADQPTSIYAPTAMFESDAQVLAAPLISVTTTPQFVAQTVEIPNDVPLLQYAFTAITTPGGPPQRLFLDGAVLVEGVFPTDEPPVFDDAAARSGTWGGRRFTNLVRNASGEQAWPHLRPAFEHVLYQYIHRSPAQTVAAIFDVQRNGVLMFTNVSRWIVYTFFGVYGWSQVQLTGWAWPLLFQLVVLVSIIGSSFWALQRWTHISTRLRVTLIFLVIAFMLIWGNTILRPLPLLDPNVYYPVARYGFPAIIPTMLVLVGGWWAGGARWRLWFLPLILVAGLAMLNVVAVATIQSFFAT